jgi:tRNA(Ile)-lysidine synthase TilS/MesJ
VLLGHNKDDCFENIITNITNKNNYDNLSGMEILKTIDGINFWRPMLNIKKADIINYANLYKIPYLFDSTPSWSVRGKIRDNLKPVLLTLKTNNNIQDETQIDSFFALKDVIKESTEIINNVIIDNLVEKLECKDNILTGLYNIKDLYVLRYKSVLRTFLAKKDIIISNKTLNDLIEYINRYILTNKERVFILNKNNTITFKNTNDNLYKKLIITYLSNE